MGKYLDLTGKRFGRLLVIEDAGRNRLGCALWLCHCDCGNDVVISSRSLQVGTQSCGCLRVEKASRPRTLNNNWKGDAIKAQSGRSRAERWFTKKGLMCEFCGKPAIDRHHKDGNTANNSKDNVQFLCRRCHMQIDGRLDKFKKSKKPDLQRDTYGRFIAM
jgi:hypothetical protein